MWGIGLVLVDCAPPVWVETRVTCPVWVSLTNTSVWPLVSSATKSEASEMNATYRPSPEISG